MNIWLDSDKSEECKEIVTPVLTTPMPRLWYVKTPIESGEELKYTFIRAHFNHDLRNKYSRHLYAHNLLQYVLNNAVSDIRGVELAKILADDDLAVYNEENLFLVAYKILLSGYDKRPNDCAAQFRTLTMSKHFLMDEVEPEYRKLSCCRKFMLEAFRWHLVPEEREQIKKMSNRWKPRKPLMSMLTVGGDDIKTVNKLEMYNVATQKWTLLKDVKINTSNPLCFFLYGRLMIIGGVKADGVTYSDRVLYHDLSDGKTEVEESIPTPRQNATAIIYGEGPKSVVYIVGGRTQDQKIVNTVEYWDPDNREWYTAEGLNIQRESCGAAVMDDCLYVFGGNRGDDEDDCLDSVEKYKMVNKRWKKKEPMNAKRPWCMGLAKEYYIYALGGHTIKTGDRFEYTMERFDYYDKTWTYIYNLRIDPDIRFTAEFAADKLIVLSNKRDEDDKQIAEEYDPVLYCWKSIPSPNLSRNNVKCLLMPGIIKQMHLLTADGDYITTKSNFEYLY